MQNINLIPRFNWDYGLSDLYKSVAFILSSNSAYAQKQVFETIFGSIPIFTNSGRTSLYTILKCLNLPEGSFVGVPLFCCPVVFDAIKNAGLVPKFIDINLDDYNIAISDLTIKKNALSAVVVVHMFGNPADMDPISALCNDLPIIEDCAQSLFSKYKGKLTGCFGTASFFSFRSGKYISAGEGSIIFSSDALLLESSKRLVETFDAYSPYNEISHCIATYIKSTLYHKPWYGIIGYPIGRRLDKKFNLSAKTGFDLKKISKCDLRIICERLKTFSEKVETQRTNALFLLDKIKNEYIALPLEINNCRNNYYQFTIRFNKEEHRNLAAQYLYENGIDCAQYLNEVVDIAKENFGYGGDCPNAEFASKTVLSIPHYYTLMPNEIEHIAKVLNELNYYLH